MIFEILSKKWWKQKLGTEYRISGSKASRKDVFESYRANDVVFLAQMKDEAPEGYYKHVMKISKSKNKMEALQLAADFTKALDHLEISEDDSWTIYTERKF